jgi:hypothetical protein
LDALWSDWFAAPAEPLTDALTRWGAPASDPEHGPVSAVALAVATGPRVLREPSRRAAVREALRLSGHPLGIGTAKKILALADPDLAAEVCDATLANPELAGLCAEYALVPSDPARRALFYLVTGQAGQYRAMDPDGSLLALAYAAATADERAHARAAMLTAGDFDLVRVIVGDAPRARLGELSDEELRYLAERHAERREWDELWTFVQDLPISACVDLVRLIDPRWAPRDDADRRLLAVLRSSLPQNVRAGMALVRERAPATVLKDARALSFAPDGPFLSVGGYATVRTIDLRTAQKTEVYRYKDPVDEVLHLADGTLIVATSGTFLAMEPEPPRRGAVQAAARRSSPRRTRASPRWRRQATTENSRRSRRTFCCWAGPTVSSPCPWRSTSGGPPGMWRSPPIPIPDGSSCSARTAWCSTSPLTTRTKPSSPECRSTPPGSLTRRPFSAVRQAR